MSYGHPMKDHPSQSHSNVASSRKASQAPSGDGANYNLQCDSSFSDDNDWDTGKLVIDLDVDTSKSPQKSVSVTPKKSAVVALTRSPIKNTGGVGHSMEHHATVDKGLKMKIKRKNAGAKSNTKGHEIVRTEQRGLAGLAESIQQQNPTVNLEKMKTTSTCDSSKDKGPKNRANQKDKKGTKERNIIKQSGDSGLANGSVFPVTSGAGTSHCNSVSVSTDISSTVTDMENQIKSSGNAPDPYEFNAKVEDRVGVPRMKKIKVEKTDGPVPSAVGMKDVGVETCSQGAMTDPDCLGPCEPGTSVTLEGIVWQENENGMLVVNVTWRGKTFVGTLLDATKHDWAPPRLGCDSPTNELETRTPKGRGKRGRGGNQVPLNDVSNTDRRLRKGRRRNSGANTVAPTFTAPPSPAKQENASLKRKGRPAEPEVEAAKKSRTCSSTRSAPSTPSTVQDELIECPEPNCSKKYRHINGLRYHQSHAHQNSIDDNGDIIKEEKMDISPSAPEKDECDIKKDDSVPKVKESKEVDSNKESVKEKDKEKSKSEKSAKGKGKKSSKQDKESSKSSKMEENDSGSSKSTVAQGKGASQTESSKAAAAEVKKAAVPATDCKANSDCNSRVATDAKAATDKIHSDTKVIVSSSSSSTSSEVVKTVETVTSQADILKSPVVSSVITSSSSSGLSVTAKKPHITYQISGPAAIGCVGNITVVSGSGQTVGTNISTITSKVGPLGVGTNITTVSVPVATVVTATTVDIPKADDKIKKAKPDKLDKVKAKGTSANRPIVPAPMTVAQGSLTTVTTHTQISPITTTTSTLKPIQPKPTIMGETTSINPALSSLKDKKTKKKKSKDKEPKELPKDLSSKPNVSSVLQVPSHSTVKDSLPKSESLSVIKSAPAANLVTPPMVVAEVVKNDAPRDMPPGRSLLVKDRVEEPPLLVQHQLHPASAANTKPPVSLTLKSPQHSVEESTEREANTSDVHSPAYSDISDANDSAPTLESESDLDRNIKTEPQGQNDGTSLDKNQEQNLSRGYGMYPYYSQPPYLVPAVQPSSNAKTGDNGPNSIKETPKKPETPNTDQKQGQPRKEMEPRELNTGSPLTAVAKGSRSAAPSPQQASPADIQRMQAQQAHMYQQYQYVYNLNAEQAYHMTMMASDPNYRAQCEKYMKDSQHQRGPVEKEGEKRGEKPRPGSETVSRPPSEPTSLHPVREGTSKGADNKLENKPPALISDRERMDREKERQQALQREREMEQNLKEKQNENHQIIKENIELKAQMDNRHRYSEYSHSQRHSEDLYRYQMMQQQQKMHQRVEDMKPIDARKHPEHSSKDIPSKEKPDIRQDLTRTRSPSTGPPIGPKDLSSPKPALEKTRHEDKLSTASPRSTPKPKDGANIPSSAASHPGYSQYMSHAAYYPAQVPYEAGHPMYRGVSPIIGYNIHPSQVTRYVSPNEPNVEKEKVAISPNTPVSEAQSKEPLQAHGPHYYGVGQPHKIHELKDVGKAGEHPSPGKQGAEQERQPSPFNKSSSEHSNSPPTQRHLHSHHHTHVVTPGYPSVIYDPYNEHARLGRQTGMSGVEKIQAFIGQPGPHPSMPPHYVPK